MIQIGIKDVDKSFSIQKKPSFHLWKEGFSDTFWCYLFFVRTCLLNVFVIY